MKQLTLSEAAVLRADGGRYSAPAARPSERRCAEASDSSAGVRVTLRAEAVKRSTADDGSEVVTVVGMACVTESGYEMWDWAGPYTEVVALDAFDATLLAGPLVEFTLNHNYSGGAPMAHTRNETLTLLAIKDAEETGLSFEAQVDPTRTDVADMVKALDRGDLAEASFKFRIVRGLWSPDYTEYRINEVDLDRGDVSAVNFGANPAAWSGTRSEKAPEKPAARAVFISEDETKIRTLRGL